MRQLSDLKSIFLKGHCLTFLVLWFKRLGLNSFHFMTIWAVLRVKHRKIVVWQGSSSLNWSHFLSCRCQIGLKWKIVLCSLSFQKNSLEPIDHAFYRKIQKLRNYDKLRNHNKELDFKNMKLTLNDTSFRLMSWKADRGRGEIHQFFMFENWTKPYIIM